MTPPTLVRIPNWVGDAVMATPALNGVLKKEEVFLLGPKHLKPLFSEFPGVSGYIELEVGRLRIYRTAKKLKGRFLKGILFTNSLSSALVFFLAGIPERYGYASDLRSPLLSRAIRRPKEELHQVEYYLRLTQALGFEPDGRELVLSVSSEARSWAEEFLRSFYGPIAVFAPGAAYGPAKMWPVEYFRRLASRLNRCGFTVLVLGGRNEEAVGRRISEGLPKTINLCGTTDLAQAAALIKKASVFVSNDSGLMHVAAALKRPQVAMFGSTDPKKTSPLNPKARVIYLGLPCSPCFKRTCKKNYECLRGISVEKVFEEVLKAASQEVRC